MKWLKPAYKKLGRIIYTITPPVRWLVIGRRVRAYVLIEYDARVLLVKNWYGDGKWSLPGGGVHKNEQVAHAAARELYEEVGITVDPRQLKFIREGFKKETVSGKHYALYGIILHHLPTLQVRSWEITDVIWVPLTALDNYDLNYEALKVFEPTPSAAP